MDAAALGPEQAALQRARLHLRGGKRRLRQGRISLGIAALFDGLISAMDWHYACAEGRARVSDVPGDFRGEHDRYAALVRSAVLDGTFDFDRFALLVDRALEMELPAGDAAGIAAGVESVLTQLGVLPFDECALPPEDPATL